MSDLRAAHYPHLVAKDAEFAVKAILDVMATTLEKGQRIEIRGFGSFQINHRPPRTGRNPKSGEAVCPVSARLTPPPEHRDAWRRDYEEMAEPMFYGERPDFDEILRVVSKFERDFNSRSTSSR